MASDVEFSAGLGRQVDLLLGKERHQELIRGQAFSDHASLAVARLQWRVREELITIHKVLTSL
jgi:hypothetical protein